MLNLGIRAHDLGKMPVEKLAGAVGSHGVSHIQLALKKSFPEFSEDRGRLSPGAGNYIRDTLWSRGISVSVLGCYINPIHPDREMRKKELERFTEHLLYARSFGSSIVGTETGSPLPDSGFTEDIYREETFKDFLGSLKVMVAAAEKTGSIVCIEGVAEKHTIYSHERMQRTLEAVPSPNLRIIYDPVNFLPADRARDNNALMEEAFRLFASRIAAIHAKDFTIHEGRKIGTLPAGTGDLDYELLIDLIRHYKPMCPVILENNTPESMAQSLKYLRNLEKT